MIKRLSPAAPGAAMRRAARPLLLAAEAGRPGLVARLTLTGGAGGATSGAGGAAPVAGGNATAGNSAGGQASVASGNSTGTAAGPRRQSQAAKVAPRLRVAMAATCRSRAALAGAGSNGNGGDVVLAGGAHDGTGVDGVVRTNGVRLVSQGNQATQDPAATLTAAQVLNGILTSESFGCHQPATSVSDSDGHGAAILSRGRRLRLLGDQHRRQHQSSDDHHKHQLDAGRRNDIHRRGGKCWPLPRCKTAAGAWTLL